MCLQYLASLFTGLVLQSQMQWTEVQVRRGLCSINKDRFVPNYTTSAIGPPLSARSVDFHGFLSSLCWWYGDQCSVQTHSCSADCGNSPLSLRTVLVLPQIWNKICFEVHSRTLNIKQPNLHPTNILLQNSNLTIQNTFDQLRDRQIHFSKLE